MQALQVVRTIDWIEETFKPIEEVIFKVVPQFLNAGREPSRGLPAEVVVDTLHESGAIMAKIAGNADAVSVLEVFGLESLISASGIKQLFAMLLPIDGKPSNTGEAFHTHRQYSRIWHSMLACRNALNDLVVPDELRRREDGAGDIFSIELTDRPELYASSIVEVIRATTVIYETIAKIKETEIAPLVIIKIESGTGLTINFKGVADVVKETKNFVIEMWSKHRHKRAEEVINHNQALASSVQLLVDIDKHAKKRSLDNEDANRLKQAVVANTLKLFRTGALIQDIPFIEVVDNSKLLDGFHNPQLQLPAPEAERGVSNHEKDHPRKVSPKKRQQGRSAAKHSTTPEKT